MKTILVVDDNATLREVTVTALNHYGYRVLEAENGEEGLQKIVDHKDIDLVFTDLIMPGRIRSVDMVQAAKEVHCRSNIKVLYTSGYPDMDKTLVGEFAEVLPKPYSIDALRSKIEQMLS